ncbi:MAG TPA: thymidine phosphorylase, partial [Polymorphobacter sp.]|nr:thymidine phosphorylase [Polymorphobacter sp.]
MFKIRRVAIDTYPENTAFLLRTTEGYGTEQFKAMRKIEIGNGIESILATLAISDDTCIVGPNEIGLGEQAFRRLGLNEG